jgi:hypothetical protein
MTDDEAKKFTTDIFESIKKSTTIEDLKKIPDELNVPIKNRMNLNFYPKIKFNIEPGEIHELMENNLIDKEFNFTADLTSRIKDPLTKLLYATLWKNGDLKKIKYIIKGIIDSEKEINDQENALVFYQFGKYLTKTTGQPIIDQHVIRAFALYSSPEKKEFSAIRKLNVLNKKHKSFIHNYKYWFQSENLTNELKMTKDYSYHIDKVLFAVGKTIKISSNKKV